MEYIVSRGYKNILVVALGGGGDVATASMLALALRRIGINSRVASVAWERYIIDPLPGPIKLEEIREARSVGNYSALVNENSYALRGGRKIIFQAARASKILKEEIGVVDLSKAALGVREGIKELMNLFGTDLVLGVDVGGDILATGYEEDLWSPLADFTGLASIKDLESILAVHSVGGDGELSQEYVLRRISLVAEKGGFLGARGMTPEDYEVLKNLLSSIESEASKTSLRAFEGFHGQISMRGGSRIGAINIINTITFLLDPRIVASLNPLINELAETKDIYEAKKILNNHGIFTELDLEEEVSRLINMNQEITGEKLLFIKKQFRTLHSRDLL
jgi:hypothetical protein